MIAEACFGVDKVSHGALRFMGGGEVLDDDGGKAAEAVRQAKSVIETCEVGLKAGKRISKKKRAIERAQQKVHTHTHIYSYTHTYTHFRFHFRFVKLRKIMSKRIGLTLDPSRCCMIHRVSPNVFFRNCRNAKRYDVAEMYWRWGWR